MPWLDTDRLLHWFICAVLGWVMIFLLGSFLVFHVWLKVPSPKIVTFTGICCVVQLAITPWLFSLRSTRQNPSGRTVQRGAAITPLFTTAAILFFSYLRRSWPDDIETRRFTSITIIVSLLFGAAGLVRFSIVPRLPEDIAFWQ